MGLDEIKDVAKDFADKAVTKTGEVVEVSKLRLELSKQQGRLRGLYQKLGSSVYSMKEKDYEDQELIDHLCEDISANLKTQKHLKARIAALKKMKICPVCGTRNPLDSVYCNQCGSRLKQEFAQETQEECSAEESANDSASEEETTK